MKKVVRTIAAVALIATATVRASEPSLRAETTSKSVVLKWDDEVTNASLSFIDSDGNVIYKDQVTGIKDYIKKFNLATLAEGNYFLRVEDITKEITYSITIMKDEVLITDEDENLKPVFRKEEGRILLNYLNLDSEEVQVAVYDSFGRKLFNETFEDEMYVSKVFNFADAFKGEYSIVVKDDSDTFYEYVSIK